MRASSSAARAWSPARSYALEAKYEFLKMLRMPAYAVPSIAFPAMFYLLFGVTFGGGRGAGPTTMATYLLATYGAFGVIGAALFGFGVGVAIERGQGWLMLKRATPMPPMAYFVAKLALAMLFAALIVLVLSVLAVTLGGVRLDAATWVRLAATLIAGAVPFCAIGLALGSILGPNSAPAVINLVYLPMSFASGLWVPIEALPAFVRGLATWLPPYHLAQLALSAFGASRGAPAWSHVLVLTGFALVGLGVAWIGYRRDEDKTYG
jgi:ABC-2 type transport system permease protein